MIAVALAGLLIGVIAFVAAAAACVRPAMRLRAIATRLPIHPVLRVEGRALESLRSFDGAVARVDGTRRRFGAAASALHEAAAAAEGYAEQVAVVALTVDGLLGLLVPRLRGTIR